MGCCIQTASVLARMDPSRSTAFCMYPLTGKLHSPGEGLNLLSSVLATMQKSLFLFLFIVLLYQNACGQVEKSNSESLKKLFLAGPSESWGTLLTEHKNEVTDSLIDGWREEAIKFYNADQYDQAHQLNDVCLFLTKTLNNTDLHGKCLLVKSEIFYYQNEY